MTRTALTGALADRRLFPMAEVGGKKAGLVVSELAPFLASDRSPNITGSDISASTARTSAPSSNASGIGRPRAKAR
jgi:hypothetical protein